MPHRLAAGALALAVFLAALRWGVMVAGGADSYGYLSQAGLWRQGSLVVHQNVVRSTPWPDAAETWAPLGYRPSPHARDALVPIYPPGLPLLMAAAQEAAGFCGAFAVVPLCGALTIWLTFALGRRLFEPPAIAIAGAALVAASPVFLYQVMNAMSDVPATAFWTLAVVLAVRRRPSWSGLAMTVAIAIRPNLAPLAAVLIAWMWASETSAARRYDSAIRFVVGAVPAAAGIAALDARLYESPLTTGYGTTGDLFVGDVATNLSNYGRWIADVETPIVALAIVYVAAPRLFPPPRVRLARLLIGGTIAATLASYVFYRPFDVWWYLRFLLPMWPAMMLATSAAIDGVLARSLRSRGSGSAQWAARAQAIAMTAIVAAIAWHGLGVAASRSVFDLWRTERRYIDVARFVADRTEPDAVVLSHQHSGSLRFYGDRLTLRFDVLDPVWLDRALEYLQSIGRRPYLVLDGGEVDAFRRRFAAVSRAGALDWPPIATLNGVVYVYDPLRRDAGGSTLAIASTRGSRALLSCDAPHNRPPVRRMK